MNNQNYAIIGDTHECVPELTSLVNRLEAEIPDVQIIHVGDYLDKGGNTAEMVCYMHNRVFGRSRDWTLLGNHEKFVYGRLTGILGPLDDPVKEAAVFGSQSALLADEGLARLFMQIYERSNPFEVLSPCRATYVTHAPCLRQHLGERDTASIRAQGNYRTVDRTIPTVEDLKWFYDDAVENGTLHIFGHMAHSGKTLEECQYKNKIFLDTGCVYGNGLSAVWVRNDEVVKYFFEPSIGSRQSGYTLPGPLGLR